MRQSRSLIVSASFALLLAACQKESVPVVEAPAAEPAPMQAPTEPVMPAAEATADAKTTSTPAANAGFSVENVPVSTAALPPFPFFDLPEGLVANVKEGSTTVDFDRHFFLAGKKMIAVEGRLHHNNMSLMTKDKSRAYTPLEFHRNYENAILALGGAKISEGQFTRAIIDEVGGLREINKHWYSPPPTSAYEHNSYLIRTADKEYWIHIGTSNGQPKGYVVVLEKTAMKQSLSFLDAAAMRTALDAAGRVSLYINFDTDKAALRPDSQPLIAEVKVLLDSNPDLKLSIEGHTDNTGSADRNR